MRDKKDFFRCTKCKHLFQRRLARPGTCKCGGLLKRIPDAKPESELKRIWGVETDDTMW